MDFFEAQDLAHKKTKRLILYYLLALLLIMLAVYSAVTLGVLLFHYWSIPEAAQSGVVAFARDETGLLWEGRRFLLTIGGVIAVVGLGSLYKILVLRGGGEAVAKSLGGEKVDRSTRNHKRRQLLNIVEEMAIASGVPVPEVYILPAEESINAFAAGWGIEDSVIAVSAGALEQLSRDELQGVVAHEYSHILNGDCRLNIRLMGVLFGIMMLSIFGRLMGALFRGGGGRRRGGVYIGLGGGRRSRRSSSGSGSSGGGGALILAVIIVVILVTIIGYIGSFFARLIQSAISRQREYLADASAVQFTRNPDGIAGALKRVAACQEKGVLFHPNAGEAAHMFFADGMARSFASLFGTHPPLQKRIREIQPNWDGQLDFPEPSVSKEPVQESRGKSAEPSVDAGKRMIEGMTILAAAGTLNAATVAGARSLTASIPETLDEKTRDPDGARQVIVALVLADNALDDEAQFKMVEDAVTEDYNQMIHSLYDEVKALPRETRLTVLELAVSTLSQAEYAGREDFLSLLNHLIQVDERLSFYEYCIRRILRERLSRKTQTAGDKASVKYLEMEPKVARAIGVVLSVVAREAAGSQNPEKMVNRAVQSHYLLNGKVTYLPPAESGIGAFDPALDTLRATAFAIRAQCLRAVVHCMQADGRLSPEEAEGLRMIGLSLAVPIPPLGALTAAG